jgi:type II secretory pathway pseudopilin PulG
MKRRQNRPWRSRSGFTLLEVGVAATVLSLTVASSLVALRMGFAMIETARNNGLAAQILQSEMENLRLKGWNEIQNLRDGSFPIESAFEATVAQHFTVGRKVADANPTLRQITLEVSWTGARGQALSRSYTSFFSQNGLNDYYYRALPH